MEIWKDIILNNRNYQISSLGNFKSLNYKRTGKEKILKCYDNGKGYKYISIGKKYYIHRLVALVFIGESNLEINHIDGNKSNNKLKNLEWVTKSENNLHKYRTLGYKGTKGTKYKQKYI